MKELKEVLGFSVSLLEALGKSLEDGKIDFTDITDLWEPISKAGDAIEGAEKILGEIKALDEAGKKVLIDYVKAEFDIPQDKLESRIEGGIQLALGLAMYVVTFLEEKKKDV